MDHWAKLPGELLDAVEGNLVLYSDKVRIRAVCDSWNSHLQKMPSHRLPWLLQAFKNNGKASHGLFNLLDKKVYLLDLPAEAQGKLFIGSSHGWILTVQDLDINNLAIDICLMNPLSRAIIQLPPRSAFPDVVDYCVDSVGEEYAIVSVIGTGEGIKNGIEVNFTDQANLIHLMGKVALSSSPSYDDCMVVAIYGEKDKLAYCKCNDKKWTPLNVDFSGPDPIGWLDVIFHKNKLYALNSEGVLVLFENISPNPKVIEIVAHGPPDGARYPSYLVECCDGGLLMVSRYVELYDGVQRNSIVRTCCFRVYKLDLGNSSWMEVKDIGEEMLFLGSNTSISMSSRDFPGYKGNHIYFTDSSYSFIAMEKQHKVEDSDIGVFNLEDGSVEALPGLKCDPRMLWPPPIWVTPPVPYY